MNPKHRVLYIFSAVVLALSLMGASWSTSYAKVTVPPTKKEEKEPAPYVEPEILESASVAVDPASSSEAALLDWAGVMYAQGAACKAGFVGVTKIPVQYLPERGQLWYYTQGMRVSFYDKGVPSNEPACGDVSVYFMLNAYQRFMMDNFPDLIKIYHFDSAAKTWTACDSTFEKDNGAHGRLVCTSRNLGFYALGWPGLGAK
jgi:hypothetical protein